MNIADLVLYSGAMFAAGLFIGKVAQPWRGGCAPLVRRDIIWIMVTLGAIALFVHMVAVTACYGDDHWMCA